MTMGLTGGFPIDLILFGMIAAFLVLRLRSILGRRTGFERPAQPYQPPQPQAAAGPVLEGQAEPASPAAQRQVPDPGSPVGQVLARMKNLDRGFDAVGFLSGAERAFRMIVSAFAAGDRGALRGLLSDEMYQAFERVIAERETQGQTQSTEIRAIHSIAIEGADLKGTVAAATVRIVSDQISLTRGRDGQPMAGTEAVTEITDIWTFERDLSRQDPTWRLVAARSA
jgi:predicted lipid-binding transport protein (Tim44 family)